MNVREVPLNVGIFNWSNADWHDVRDMMISADVHALAVVEVSDQAPGLQRLHNAGWGLIRPNHHVGQAAVSLIYNPRRLDLRLPVSVLLQDSVTLDSGTGPEHMKPKYMNGGKFQDMLANRRVGIAGYHPPPDQEPGKPTPKDDNIRARIATQMNHDAIDYWADWGGIPINALDSNAREDSPTLEPYDQARRRGNWHMTQKVSPKPTHGPRWNPDTVAWRDDERIRLEGHVTIGVPHSDHRADIARFMIAVRNWRG
jgi:hypothetical protein